MCESWGGRPGLPVPNGPYSLCGRKVILEEEAMVTEVRRCARVGVAVVGSPPSWSVRSLWT